LFNKKEHQKQRAAPEKKKKQNAPHNPCISSKPRRERPGRTVDLFLNIVDEELICTICSGVFLKLTDLSCGHVYCKKCIEKSLEQ